MELEGKRASLLKEIIAPGGTWAGVVKRGQILRLTDLEGTQAVDFLCYNANDTLERYCAADTIKIAGQIFIGKGSLLYSDMGRVLFTVLDDTCGKHDSIGGCCSRESNKVRYGLDDGPNCRDNFLRALKPFGLGKRDIVSNLNFFMYVPVGDAGEMAIVDGHSRAGDYVELRAEMDVLSVLSNCPQMNNPANGYKLTPISVEVLYAV